MKAFQVTCTVESDKLYDALLSLEPYATDIVSVPIKSQSRALTTVNGDARLPRLPRLPRRQGVRMKMMLAYINKNPKFTRGNINAYLVKNGVISRADPVLMQMVENGQIKRVGIGEYEVADNG